MGALNAAIIILGTRSELLLGLPPGLKLGLYAYFGIYTVIANAPPSSVAVLALLQASIILLPLAALGAILARREAS